MRALLPLLGLLLGGGLEVVGYRFRGGAKRRQLDGRGTGL